MLKYERNRNSLLIPAVGDQPKIWSKPSQFQVHETLVGLGFFHLWEEEAVDGMNHTVYPQEGLDPTRKLLIGSGGIAHDFL